MGKGSRRRYGAAKLEAVRRIEAGESVAAVAREIGAHPGNVYRWCAAVRRAGEQGLREAGRPRLQDLAGPPAFGPAEPVGALKEAARQIAELERKVGQQQVDLDFFEQALRRIEASPRPSGGAGATPSSPRSGR